MLWILAGNLFVIISYKLLWEKSERIFLEGCKATENLRHMSGLCPWKIVWAQKPQCVNLKLQEIGLG